MNISYDWYRIFDAVAVCGNITAASEQLYISQPAVSQSIKQLETALGCALFIRTARGVRLTAEGETLHQCIAKGIEQIRLGEKRLETLLNMDSGELRIGASDMTLKYYLLPYLEKYHKLYPNIKIFITNQPTPDIMNVLEAGLIDFGVISQPVDDIKDYIVIPVREIEDIFICGRDYIGLRGSRLSLEELASKPLILLEKNTSARKYIDKYFLESGINVTPEFELGTSNLIVHFVRRNMGIGCVVRDFAEDDIINGTVYELNLEKRFDKRKICVVRKPTIISRASEKLLEMLAP